MRQTSDDASIRKLNNPHLSTGFLSRLSHDTDLIIVFRGRFPFDARKSCQISLSLLLLDLDLLCI